MGGDALGAAPAAAPQPRPIEDSELQLLSRYMGQDDLQALREHVIDTWRRAISGPAPVYLCIRSLMFLEPRIKAHPSYELALQTMAAARAAGGGIWLDVGAAVGTDVRQLRVDGLAKEEVVALDVPEAEHYWQIGLDLYQDAAHPPCACVFGDITADDAFLLPSGGASPPLGSAAPGDTAGPPLATSPTTAQPAPAPPNPGGTNPGGASPADGQLGTLEGGMQGLVGRVTVASCTAVLHCLPKETGSELLGKARLLLRPGGLLLGSTLGAVEAQEWEAAYQAGHRRWLHSVGSLKEELEGLGYQRVEVAPTKWRDLDAGITSNVIQLQDYVGRQPWMEGRLMLAFTAWKPGSA